MGSDVEARLTAILSCISGRIAYLALAVRDGTEPRQPVAGPGGGPGQPVGKLGRAQILSYGLP